MSFASLEVSGAEVWSILNQRGIAKSCSEWSGKQSGVLLLILPAVSQINGNTD